MSNKHSILLICILLLTSCSHEPSSDGSSSPSQFQYPPSKYWAHRVNTIELGREKTPLFDGLEIDINYSEWQNTLFVGHELEDTILGLSFDAWLDSLPQPVTNCLWIDTKNLTIENASRIAHLILNTARHHNIEKQLMVESWDENAVKIVKDSGLYVILWTDNPIFSGKTEEEWLAYTEKQINLLHPDALSGDFLNFERLTNDFPDYNIHIWDTPRAYNDTNVAHSKNIAAHPSVKVVLVDYPSPPEIQK